MEPGRGRLPVTAELGAFALVLALVLSALQAGLSALARIQRSAALRGAGEGAAPLLSNLVDVVAERDDKLLDELERLVRDKRRHRGRRQR